MRRQNWFFLRGLIRESGHWSGFLEKFQAAFPERQVISLDLPGAGPRFRERSPATIAQIAEKVRAEFLKLKGEENFLVAVSLGAMVGLQWMHAHPEDLQGAVLINTSLRGLSPFHHRLSPANFARILKIALSPDLRLRERLILEMTSSRRELHERISDDWTRIQEERPVSLGNSLRQILAAARFHPPREKPAGRILLLNSAKDRLVSPECSRAIASHWNVPLRIHPEAGHDLTLDEPEWVLERVREEFSS